MSCRFFLDRVWRLSEQPISDQESPHALLKVLHQTIRKVSTDTETLQFNTAIAANMELLNTLGRCEDQSGNGRALMQEALEAIVLMLSPIVPHIAQALWSALGHADSVVDCRWPQADRAALVRDSIELVIQVNGKMRGKVAVAADAADADIRAAALAEPNVQRFMAGKQPRKVIIVPRRLVNVVVG